jgi:hypothetical protein
MRSVFIHLWHTTEDEVAAVLDRLYPTQRSPWLLKFEGDTHLYIHFYRDGPVEDDDWIGRFRSRGGPPAVCVMADISGRHEGWPQTREFALQLLGNFDGVATDDGWLRLWSRDEVANDRIIDGRRFGCWRDL